MEKPKMLEIAVLHDFVDDWNSIHSDSDLGLNNKLKNFIEAWYFCAEPQFSNQTQAIKLNPSILNDFIADIDPLFCTIREERRNGDSVNVWEVAGLGHDEVRVSSVFAWFLNCHAEHGQADSLLSAIVDKLPNKPDRFPKSEKIQSKPYWVYVESCASGERSSRIDIEIEGEEFLVFIEVKIFAGETNDQLRRYLQIAEQKAGTRSWGIIYLTPDGKEPSILHPMLLALSWKDVADVFQNYSKLYLPALSYSRQLISQFSKHILEF